MVPLETLLRIAAARRTISELRLANRRAFAKKFQGTTIDTVITTMFESSLQVEPDGAGLPCIIQAARELVAP